MRLRLICIDQTLKNGPGYLVAGGRYPVGRSSRCSVVIDDLSVSRHHADLLAKDDMILVQDRESRNGTFVDGLRIKEAEVKPGQMVRFGSAQFQVVGYELPDGVKDDNSDLSTRFVNAKLVLRPAAVQQLSDGQRRVLDLLLKGLSEKEVATQLDLSPHTVHDHVKEIYRKMEVNSRPELLALFVPDGTK